MHRKEEATYLAAAQKGQTPKERRQEGSAAEQHDEAQLSHEASMVKGACLTRPFRRRSHLPALRRAAWQGSKLHVARVQIGFSHAYGLSCVP